MSRIVAFVIILIATSSFKDKNTKSEKSPIEAYIKAKDEFKREVRRTFELRQDIRRIEQEQKKAPKSKKKSYAKLLDRQHKALEKQICKEEAAQAEIEIERQRVINQIATTPVYSRKDDSELEIDKASQIETIRFFETTLKLQEGEVRELVGLSGGWFSGLPDDFSVKSFYGELYGMFKPFENRIRTCSDKASFIEIIKEMGKKGKEIYDRLPEKVKASFAS